MMFLEKKNNKKLKENMINKNNNYSINLEINIPHDNENIINSFITEVKEITDKYIYQPLMESTIVELNYELEYLLSKEIYKGILLRNDDFYYITVWDLKDILHEYELNYPQRYDKNKSTYTNIEVNNILFELHIKKVIGGYDCVAVPYDIPSYNDKIFDKSIRVELPIINIGSQKEHNHIKSIMPFVDLETILK